MESRRLWSAVLGRRRWLWGLLVAALAVLALCWNNVRLSLLLDRVQGTIRKHDFDLAIELLNGAETQGRNSARWHYLMACARRRAGESDGVYEALERAALLHWDGAEIERQRLLLRAQSGQVKAVEEELSKLTQSHLSDDVAEEVYEAIARGHLTAVNVGEAVRCLKFWADWQPKNELPRLWMADLQALLDNHAAAITHYQAALAVKPDLREARVKLGRSLALNSELDEAAAVFEQCIAQFPDDIDAILGLAEIARRQGATQQAKDLLYDALTCDLPSDRTAFALTELGQIALEERGHARAKVLLTDATRANPSLITAHQALATVLAAMGEQDSAAAQQEKVSELRAQKVRLNAALQGAMEDPRNADHRATVGMIYLEQGRLSDAAEWLNIAVQINPRHREAHAGLARYYGLIGDPLKARQHQQIANSLTVPTTPTSR